MKFFLKRFSELTTKDFELHQIWGIYYEPDDMISLVELGYKFDDIQNELKNVNYSDEYAFPIPNNGANTLFQYMYYTINARTACGKIFNGYCCSRRAFAIALFYNDERYTFNLGLKDQFQWVDKYLSNNLNLVDNLSPLPILGIPGWYQGNQDRLFYENKAYFREKTAV